jgi:hypothetical protein
VVEDGAVVGGGALVEGGAVVGGALVGGAWGQRRAVGLLGPVDHSVLS